MLSRPLSRLFVLVVLSGSLSAVPGCASWFAKGDTIVSYRQGDSPQPREAPGDGEYSLHNMFGNVAALRTVSLQRGDALGFRKEKPEEVVAVAGDREYVLTDGNYVWKRK
jgi:hypothetical protein